MGNKGSSAKGKMPAVVGNQLTVVVGRDDVVFTTKKESGEMVSRSLVGHSADGSSQMDTVAKLRQLAIDYTHMVPSFDWGKQDPWQLALCADGRELRGDAKLNALIEAEKEIEVRILPTRIFIRQADNESKIHTIYCFPNDTVADVRRRAAEQLGCELNALKFAYRAKEEKDSTPISGLSASVTDGQITLSFMIGDFPEGFLKNDFSDLSSPISIPAASAPTPAPTGVATSSATVLSAKPAAAANAATINGDESNPLLATNP